MKKGKRDENISEAQKPIYKKWWFWLIIAIIVFAGIGGNSNPKTETKKETKTETSAEISNESSADKEAQEAGGIPLHSHNHSCRRADDTA